MKFAQISAFFQPRLLGELHERSLDPCHRLIGLPEPVNGPARFGDAFIDPDLQRIGRRTIRLLLRIDRASTQKEDGADGKESLEYRAAFPSLFEMHPPTIFFADAEDRKQA